MDRRKHYLEVALDLFAAHGFHGVSIDQLVAAAGGSKATLYRYFSSKEELFEAIIADLTDATISDRSVDELADLGLEEGLRAIGQATARAALSEQATVLFRLAVGEYVRFPELAQAMFERGPAVSYARLREFIARRVAAGEIQVDDPQIAAEQFLGGVIGHLQLRRALGQDPTGPSQITARVEAGVKTFLAAYRAR
ncbi:MAG: TetR/AcrR family transcriptional regulator [Acidimicrobiia bacterium]